MDCDVCNTLLLDLVYDELDEVRAAAARRHLDGCDACRAAFERLHRGHALAQKYVAVEAPAPDDAFLAAIRTAVERASAPPAVLVSAPEVQGPIAEVHPLRVPRWLRRAGEVAMRRQVAMAAVFLLMVGVGLRFYQYQPPPRATDPDTSVAPEVIPATELPHATTGAATAGPSSPGPAALRRPAQLGARSIATAPVPSEVHRALPALAPASPPSIAAAPAPVATTSLLPSDAVPRTRTAAAAGAGRSADDLAPMDSAAYRNQAAPRHDWQPPAAGRVATVDPGLQQALPVAPTGSPLADGLPPPVPGVAWQTLRDHGDDLAAHHQIAQAIAAYERAYEQAPDADAQRRIAISLRPLLVMQGRDAEANRLFGETAVAPNDRSGLASSAPHVPSSVPHPAVARPAHTRPPTPAASSDYQGL